MYIVLTFDSLFIVYILTYVLTKFNTICIVDLKSSVELVFYVSTLNKTLFIYLFNTAVGQ